MSAAAPTEPLAEAVAPPPPVVDATHPPSSATPAVPVLRLLMLDSGFTLNGELVGKMLDVSPEEQERTLTTLRARLIAMTADPRLRETDGSSRLMLKVRGERSAKWKYVERIMQVCAEPQIKIYRMGFEVVQGTMSEPVSPGR